MSSESQLLISVDNNNRSCDFGLTTRLEESSSERAEPSWNLLALVGNFKTPAKLGDTISPPLASTATDAPAEKAATESGDGRERRRRSKPDDGKSELKKDLPPESSLKNGDIIFVSSSAFEEARAIQTVSKSPMTHCGILFKEGNDWFVYEAVQPVKKTPLKDFHKTDDGETYVVRRLKEADQVLTQQNLDKMQKYLQAQEGKDYDHLFGWGDDKMYCSELVWKAYYDATRLKVGQVQMIGDFDLSDPLVKKHVEARYGKNVPVTEPTIPPGRIYESRRLKTVK